MAKYVFVVFTEPVEGQDAEYNEWYSDVHIPDVLKLDGITAARRFKLASMTPGQEGHPSYLALYEIETDDISKIPVAIREAVQQGRMPLSAALDQSKNHVAYYEGI
jgi:hypothetical protein